MKYNQVVFNSETKTSLVYEVEEDEKGIEISRRLIEFENV